MLRVARQGGIAIHVVGSAIAKDTVANLKVDWSRRFDHMQQHSGIVGCAAFNLVG